MNDFGIAFSILGFDVKWYSILIVIGVLIGYAMILSETKRFNIKKEFVFNVIFWAIIFGIIGARLYYVAFNWDYYAENLSEIYKIWHGGIAIHGALIAGAITVIIYTKKYNANSGRILDIIVPPLLFAQAIGRWGNFFNSEAFGSIVSYNDLINMKIIPSFVIDNMYINGSYHLPMFYFESLWCIVGFIILLFIRRRRYIKCGESTAFYLIWYSIGRFVIETFRTDSLMLGELKIAKLVSILMLVVGVVVIIIQKRKPKLDELYNSSEIEDIKY